MSEEEENPDEHINYDEPSGNEASEDTCEFTANDLKPNGEQWLKQVFGEENVAYDAKHYYVKLQAQLAFAEFKLERPILATYLCRSINETAHQLLDFNTEGMGFSIAKRSSGHDNLITLDKKPVDNLAPQLKTCIRNTAVMRDNIESMTQQLSINPDLPKVDGEILNFPDKHVSHEDDVTVLIKNTYGQPTPSHAKLSAILKKMLGIRFTQMEDGMYRSSEPIANAKEVSESIRNLLNLDERSCHVSSVRSANIEVDYIDVRAADILKAIEQKTHATLYQDGLIVTDTFLKAEMEKRLKSIMHEEDKGFNR